MKAHQPPAFLTDPEAPRRLERYLQESIPLVGHMDVRVLASDVHGVLLEAPLAPNRNHIGTAFGASLHGLAMLACWGLVWLALEDHADREIVVADSRMSYRAPAAGTFQARCPLPPPEAVAALRAGYAMRGRARIALDATINAGGAKPVATFSGTFVALRAKA
jgi:thioesterase domain-containing protein